MAIEIERKWLVKEVPTQVERVELIKQTYLADADRVSLRVRTSELLFSKLLKLDVNVGHESIKTAYVTVKSPNPNGYSNEHEMDIPVDAAVKILADSRGVIEKIRADYSIKQNGCIFVAELDTFVGKLAGLRLVEVEFQSVEDADSFVAPDWFGEDVTNDPQYKNVNLFKKVMS